MASITVTTNNMQYVHLFEHLAQTLKVPFKKVEQNSTFSSSMQQALEEEEKGQVTKLMNHKNAVAEILG